MDIAFLENLMQSRSMPDSIIREIAVSTKALPSQGILDSLGSAPTIAGLSPLESEFLLIRMLERVAAMFGAHLTDEDVPGLSGLPDVDDLISKVSNDQVASLLRAECARLTANNGRCHERG